MTCLSSEPPCGAFRSRNSARHDASASAPGASQAFDERRYRGIRFDTVGGERLRANGASVAAMKAPHHHDEVGRPHDQSSSASRVTARSRNKTIMAR